MRASCQRQACALPEDGIGPVAAHPAQIIQVETVGEPQAAIAPPPIVHGVKAHESQLHAVAAISYARSRAMRCCFNKVSQHRTEELLARNVAIGFGWVSDGEPDVAAALEYLAGVRNPTKDEFTRFWESVDVWTRKSIEANMWSRFLGAAPARL